MSDFSFPTTWRQSILWTVAYTNQFNYPLTQEEIWQRLFCVAEKSTSSSSKPPQKSVLQKQLEYLVVHHQLSIEQQKKRTLFCLPGQEKCFALREHRESVAAQKWPEVENFIHLISWIPWIESIWVTGSLAMNNTEPNQDIDFMIVTQARRLWLSRFVISLLVLAVGKKRNPFGSEAHTWCLNLWLDTQQLVMPPQKRNLYTAYEVIQARVVFERHHSAQQFWSANKWVKDFIMNWSLPKNTFISSPNSAQTIFSRFFDWIEDRVFWFQSVYMKKRQTTEYVGKEYAFFHPRQTSQLVMQQWQQAIKKIQ